jgi:enamine deaminase RidA (YjgF/YER057c/UK114 family)
LRRVEANRPWAKTMGYARAVRIGSVVEVSGTAAAARAHDEIFEDVRPANTTVGGLEFIDPAILVEVEVSAVVRPG